MRLEFNSLNYSTYEMSLKTWSTAQIGFHSNKQAANSPDTYATGSMSFLKVIIATTIRAILATKKALIASNLTPAMASAYQPIWLKTRNAGTKKRMCLRVRPRAPGAPVGREKRFGLLLRLPRVRFVRRVLPSAFLSSDTSIKFG